MDEYQIIVHIDNLNVQTFINYNMILSFFIFKFLKYFFLAEVATGTRISHMDVMSSEIEAVDNDILQGTHIESLRLMSNRIGIISERAFA